MGNIENKAIAFKTQDSHPQIKKILSDIKSSQRRSHDLSCLLEHEHAKIESRTLALQNLLNL